MTIKDLKPPFKVDEMGVIRDCDGFNVVMVSIEVATNESLESFVIEALNEKWQREHGEVNRWNIEDDDYNGEYPSWINCPTCGKSISWEGNLPNYCPSCGVKLGSPEEVTG